MLFFHVKYFSKEIIICQSIFKEIKNQVKFRSKVKCQVKLQFISKLSLTIITKCSDVNMDEEEFTDKNLKDTFLKDLQNPPPSPLPPRKNSFTDNNERINKPKVLQTLKQLRTSSANPTKCTVLIWSHILKKSLIEKFTFQVVNF